MTDDRFEKALEELRRSYNRPPETPRDEMWTAIETARAEETDGSVISLDGARERGWWRRTGVTRWTGWAVAAAALLVLGIGIGRVTVEPGAVPGMAEAGSGPSVEEAPTAPADARSGAAFRFAAVSHLLKAEPLLTMVRSDAQSGRYDAAVGGWASDLLTQTRLLIDSPAADDPALAELLEDLELILIQLARVSDGEGERGMKELELVNEGIDRQDMLLRIQAVVPARPGLVGA